MSAVPKEAGGQEKSWLPLNMKRGLANETADIDKNISATLASTYVPFTPLLNAHSGAVSIVGSGPSLKSTWQKLKGDVMACNSAGKFLLEKGVVPKYWMMFDADPLLIHSIRPHKDVTYLVASRCHRSVFELLKDCKVYVWHAKGDLNLDELLEKEMARRHAMTGKWELEPMCGGGSTAVTRCMFLVYAFGYRTQHLFGVDSSYDVDFHVSGESADDHQQKRMIISTGPRNPRQFNTTTWLAAQAEDFMVLSKTLKELNVKIVVHGTGLIPHLAGELGFDVDGQSKLYQVGRDVAQKTRLLWNVI